MTLYRITYRANDGSRAVIELKATSKTEVFPELKSRGINAISITEAKQSSLNNCMLCKKTAQKVILLVSFLAALFIFYKFTVTESKLNLRTNGKKHLSLKDDTTNESNPSRFVARKLPEKTKKLEKPVISNPNVLFSQTVKGRLVKWKTHSKPVFNNMFENFVGSILTAIPGERFLEIDLESEFDEAFRASLTNKIEISSQDSDEIRALKVAVIEAKEEVRKQVMNGMRPRDVITAARDEMNKIADYRDNLQSEFDKYLITEKDPIQVLAFAKEANEILAEYGAYPLEAPDDIEQAEDAMLNARENRLAELEAKVKLEERINDE